MKKSVFSRIASLAVAAAMMVTSCLGLVGESGKSDALAAGTYKLQEYTPEQIMGNYGVIAFGKFNMNAHCHSNFLVKHLNASSDSGLRASYDPYNKTEEFYFETFGSVNAQMSNSPQSGYLYIGKDVTVRKTNDGTDIRHSVYTGLIKNPGPDRVTHETASDRYADMDDIAVKMKKYNQDIKGLSATGNVSYDFSDQNRKTITCTGSNSHVINMSGTDFFVNTSPIRINFADITEADTETSLVINIDMKGVTSPQIGELILQYGGAGVNSSEANATSNHNRIYYNFYDSSKGDGQYTGAINFNGRGFGTIIAPSAAVVLGQNWDGVAVGNNVQISGEFHRIVNPIAAPEFSDPDYQEETGEIILAKTKTGGDLLAGAKLELEIKSVRHDLAGVTLTANSNPYSAYTLTNNNKIIQWTSGTAAVKFSDLPEGEYTWRETQAPTTGGNFEIAPEIRFKVGADGNIYMYTGNDDYSTTAYDNTQPVNMVDGVIVQAQFSKKADENSFGIKSELPGAELKLTIIPAGPKALEDVSSVSGTSFTRSADNKSITWTSGTTPAVFDNLPNGEYTWEELSTPAGYKKSEPVKFKIESEKIYLYDNNTGRYQANEHGPKLEMVDEIATADGSFSKRTVAGTELPGASMSITMTSGEYKLNHVKVVSGHTIINKPLDWQESTDTRVFKFTWTSTGTPLELQGLPVGEYVWEEVMAPSGYQKADPVKFKVSTNGKIYVYNDRTGTYTTTDRLVMVDHLLSDPDTPDTPKPNPGTTENPGGNDPVNPGTTENPGGDTPVGTGNLTVIVYDEKTKDIVPNATVVITYPDGVTQRTDVTNSNGELSLIKVPAGEYTVVTTKVPDGYTVTAGKEHKGTVVVDETTVLEVLINTDVGSLIITVYDEKTNEVVPNATVTVTYPDGSKSPYITDSEGKITLTNIPVGKYVTETTKVPDGYTVTVGKTYETTVVANQTSECKIYIVTDKTDKSVNTGDAFKVFPFVMIMIAALFGIVIMIVKRKNAGNKF